jgi:hypothetical protein
MILRRDVDWFIKHAEFEWIQEGPLRHIVYPGERVDKSVSEVVRDRPARSAKNNEKINRM